MTLRAEQKYRGEITLATWTESSKGTLGLAITIEADTGDEIQHTFWLTDNTKENFEERMLDFGITKEELANGSFMENELAARLERQQVTFGTKLETYKEKDRVRVAWIGRHKGGESDDRGSGYAAAKFFSKGKGKQANPDITDDDIPF